MSSCDGNGAEFGGLEGGDKGRGGGGEGGRTYGCSSTNAEMS